MKRKSLITAISLPKETSILLEKLQNKFHKTRSELLREMISFYVNSSRSREEIKSNKEYIDDHDANKIIKLYYKLLSETKPKPAIVVGISIINKKDRVIIGLRKNADPNIKDLHWTFSSGKFASLNFEKELLATIKRETGFTAKILQLVHARLIPDSPNKKIRIIALYYHCKIVGGKQKPGGDFKELKWVPAIEVSRHFTTSVADEVINFLGTL